MDGSDSATLSRSIEGEGGATILIEETSGAAFAEAERAPIERAGQTPGSPRARKMLVWIGAALAAGLAAQFAWTRLRPRPSPRRRHAVAFAPDQTDPENITQTRDAGPAAMRDPVISGWDSVDEASDQSFPASDPSEFPRASGR